MIITIKKIDNTYKGVEFVAYDKEYTAEALDNEEYDKKNDEIDWLALVDGYCYVGRQRSWTWIKLDSARSGVLGSTRSANASVVLRLGTPTNRGEGRVGS